MAVCLFVSIVCLWVVEPRWLGGMAAVKQPVLLTAVAALAVVAMLSGTWIASGAEGICRETAVKKRGK